MELLLDYLQSNATFSTTSQEHPEGRSAEQLSDIIHEILKIEREIRYDKLAMTNLLIDPTCLTHPNLVQPAYLTHIKL